MEVFDLNVKKLTHKIYNNAGVDYFLDKPRNSLIQVTLEEQVRQDVIASLIGEYGYPVENLSTEYLIKTKAKGNVRADIVVWSPSIDKDGNKEMTPFMVIECKSRDIMLNDDHLQQVFKYREELNAPYFALTNGLDFWTYRYDPQQESGFSIEDIPNYDQCLSSDFVPNEVKATKLPPQKPLTIQMLNNSQWVKEKYEELSDWIIGLDTPEEFWPLAINLDNLIIFEDLFIQSPINWLGYTILQDLGVSSHTFGNAAGGSYYGDYRSFLVKDPYGNDQVVRFIVVATGRCENDSRFGNSKGRTFINVAICNSDKMHNSLQLCLDTFAMKTSEGGRLLYHDGRMTVGNLGKIPRKRVLDFVSENQPSLIHNSKIYLGKVPTTKILIWADVQDVFYNLIVYSLLRDDLRSIITQEKKTP